MIPGALQRFLASLGTLGPRDDRYPVEELRLLDPLSLRVAVDALVERMEDHDDARAARTLAAIDARHTAPAVVSLAERLPQGTERGLAWVAALTLGVDDAVDPVAAQIRFGTVLARIAALLACRDRREPALCEAVLDALGATLVVVRLHAFDAWVRQAGIEGLVAPARSPLDTLRRQLISDLPILWQDAAEEIRALATSLRHGSTPEDLDLVYRPSTPDAARLALAHNLAHEDQPLDLELIGSFAGHDRRAVEVVLALRAGPQRRDPRVPAVLAVLNPRWALGILDEAVEQLTDDHPFGLAVALAMPVLLSAEG